MHIACLLHTDMFDMLKKYTSMSDLQVACCSCCTVLGRLPMITASTWCRYILDMVTTALQLRCWRLLQASGRLLSGLFMAWSLSVPVEPIVQAERRDILKLTTLIYYELMM